jgi:hypothetical protein
MCPFTHKITAVETTIGGKEVILIDNPGFNFAEGIDEVSTFEQLAGWLKKYDRFTPIYFSKPSLY